jgi:hypothetical protein
MWGANYKKLYEIKKRYDSRGLFWVSPGIGSDDFSADPKTGRVCRIYRNGTVDSASQMPTLFDNQNMADNAPTTYNLGPESQESADRELVAKEANVASKAI